MLEDVNQTDFALKLKKLKSKRIRNFTIKISCISLVFIMVIAYFISPLSRCNLNQINGNYNYSKDDIITLSGISKSNSLYLISKEKIIENLKENPLIESDSINVDISVKGLKIQITEIAPMFKYNGDIYMSNGEKIDEKIYSNPNPLIGDFLKSHVESDTFVEILNQPKSENLPYSKYSTICQLFKNTRKEDDKKYFDKNLIKAIDYQDGPGYLNLYFDSGIEDNRYLNVVFSIDTYHVEDLYCLFEDNVLERELNCLKDQRVLENFVPYMDDKVNKEIYSIKILVKRENNQINYFLKYNNVDGNNSEIVEINK